MALVAFPDTNTTISVPQMVLEHAVVQQTLGEHTFLQHMVVEHTVVKQIGSLNAAAPARGRWRLEVLTRPPVRTRFTITLAGASLWVLTLCPPSSTDWGGRPPPRACP